MQQRVLVTGANGLLGSNVVRQLIARGIEVVALLRSGSNRKALSGLSYNVVEGEITHRETVMSAVKGCDAVIHCAADTSQNKTAEELKVVNVDATGHIIAACKSLDIRMVFVSTANCFTNGTLQHPGTEESGFMPWLKQSGYAYSKYRAQALVLSEVQQGLDAVVVAPTFMLGPGDAKRSSGKLLLHGLHKRLVLYPPGGKSFVDAEYAAIAVVNALTLGKSGTCYLLAGVNLTYHDFFKRIKQTYNPKGVFLPIPRWVLVAAGAVGQFLQHISGRTLALNRTNQRLLCLDNYFSGAKAEAELHLPPTDVDNAIQKAVEWFEKES